MSEPVLMVVPPRHRRRPVFSFREEDHTYALDGKPMLSVTKVLQLAGLISFDGIPPEVLGAAQARGTRVHTAAELDDQGRLDLATVAEEDIGYLAAWQRFRRETGFRPEHVERQVYNARWMVAGTLDRIGMMGRARYLLDIKSGIRHPAVGPQTAAYEACMKYKQLRRAAVYLHADGTYDVRILTDRDDLATFLAALRLVRWREKHLKG